jgi:hypothetical protein
MHCGTSEHFPAEVMEKRRKLLPIMKKPGLSGKKLIIVWTLNIDKQLYRGPVYDKA